MFHLASALDQQVSDSVIGLIAVCGAFTFLLTAVVGGVIRSTIRTRAQEQTKRELAACIAEGSMKPEDAERIINAGKRSWGKCR